MFTAFVLASYSVPFELKITLYFLYWKPYGLFLGSHTDAAAGLKRNTLMVVGYFYEEILLDYNL